MRLFLYNTSLSSNNLLHFEVFEKRGYFILMAAAAQRNGTTDTKMPELKIRQKCLKTH